MPAWPFNECVDIKTIDLYPYQQEDVVRVFPEDKEKDECVYTQTFIWRDFLLNAGSLQEVCFEFEK